jgi:hypothetical protein
MFPVPLLNVRDEELFWLRRAPFAPKIPTTVGQITVTYADEAFELVVPCLYVTIRRCRGLYFCSNFCQSA